MRLSAVATVGIVLGLTLALSSCGGDASTAASGPASTGSTASAPAAAKSGKTVAESRHACKRALGPFVSSLAALRDDLARGLSYDDYLGRVRGTRAVYAKVQPRRVPAGCLVVSGGPAERAFNLYIDAANTWGDCLATVTCNTRSIEPRLQRKWALAESRLALAQKGLSPGNG
ncbi:MAG TPA: hypothetical protein VG816_11975 [Solirubrobacterales bacterium]|nr:hypothetical protein [Solirubrobacterales bacterium]